MNGIRSGAALGLLLLAACGGRRSAADMEGLLTPLTVEPPPIYAIIGARADLELSSVQVAALDSIAMDIQATNRPLIEELEAATPSGRTGRRRITEAGEPILAEIRANSRQGSEGVHALLTEDQRSKVCSLFERTALRGTQRASSPPADSAATNAAGSRWYWCSPAGADEDGEAGARQAVTG